MSITSKRVIGTLLALLLGLGSPAPKDGGTAVDPTQDQYRVFYQIFVGSFSDSDGDGIGDLRGIINRMDYLNDGDVNSGESLGVQGLWLSPIFESPSYHKYDVQDYYAIDGRFGSIEDFLELLELCHSRNVQVILDLVLNHSSSRNRWFNDFCSAHRRGDTENEYYNFFSWCTAEERKGGIAYRSIPGCEGEYYECNFSSDMPELNYDNDSVRQRMLSIAKYWLDLGVDGFRFDAVKYIYYGETSRCVDFWNWYMQQLREYKPDIYCVGECWSGEPEILQYYSAMNCFNFGASQAEGPIAMAAKGGDINRYVSYVCSFQEKVHAANPQGMSIPFLSNHDMDRSSGYLMLANGFPQLGASLYLLSGGSPFIYYGEEIGMKGTRGSANTDANRRLAMLWGDGDSVKDPIGTTYAFSKQTNGTVASQSAQESSLLRHYQKLISLRIQYPQIPRGDYAPLNCGNSKVGGFLITYEGQITAVVHNVSREDPICVDLSKAGPQAAALSQLLECVGKGEASLDGSLLTIGPQTSVILQ